MNIDILNMHCENWKTNRVKLAADKEYRHMVKFCYVIIKNKPNFY